ncbi:MAG: NAD-dependent epimerase/dehydratase family protein [Bacteroidales bacterium]|jgi:UDP-glucose 4-epimerase|nr:NAD-dependent epimerase/dehydratase family protein [Bacteroidales bacterium]
MKILITGVAGFIGSNLANQLLKRNHEIVGIDNLSYGSLNNIEEIISNDKFQFIQGDICNPLLLKDIKAELIIHLASQKIPRYSSAYRTLEENSIMLKNIVNKCLADKCKILFASTSDVYGKNKDLPFKEDSDFVLGDSTVKRWAYALSKIYGEQYIIANSDEFGLNYTIVRFFGSYGTNQNLTWWGGPQSLFISKAFRNEAIEIHGDGLQTRTFTYIEDTVAALINCVESKKSDREIFNIASNPEEEISILNLGKLIWKLINGEGSIPKIVFIPYSNFGKYEDVQRRVPNITKIKENGVSSHRP